jgi:hypothetical protein
MTDPVALPDDARWVQANAIAAAGGWRRGRVVGDDASRLAVALAGATAAEVEAALTDRRGWTLLVPAPEPDADRLARELAARGWAAEPAALYTLPDGAHVPDDHGAGVIDDAARAASLAHVDAALAEELARTRGPLVAINVDGVAAAFAHAPWRTARWFELAADTLPAYRQLGLATHVAAFLIRHERAQGRGVVMGALDVSLAAQRLARRLGMAPAVRMYVAWPPD